jgi:8-amino-7-oxononanoate synthase
MERRINAFLQGREQEGMLRQLTRVSPDAGGNIRIDGTSYVNLSSNDYLGVSSHPYLAQAASKALLPVVGSSASRLMTGSTDLHHILEEKIAVLKGKPAALVFNSGYQANVGIISALCGKDDCIFSDRLNHASIVDGIRLSGAKLFRFKHNDTAHLEELICKERGNYREALIVTETVFSMDGDIAPLPEIARLKEKYGCTLMVDEAHATGVFGENGGGITELTHLAAGVDIIMGTFSKALGGFGSYAATSEVIRDYLVNACRSFIYSTALPPVVIAADLAALEVLETEPHRRKQLLANASYLRQRLTDIGLCVKGESQIIPVVVGENESAVRMSRSLREKGYWVTPVRPPTVPKGEARLRLSITFDQSREVLDRFAGDVADL